jgi:FOG: CheY-like receiver
MPIMDGYETARILKEKMNNGEIPKVPIVALTANEGQAEIQKCKEAGMDEVLFKPIQKDVLAKIFKEYRLNVDM